MKFGICTNFDTRNAVIKSKLQKFQNLTPLVTSQSPGTKKGSKANNFKNNRNTNLKLDTCTNLTREIQWWSPNIKKFKVWPRSDVAIPRDQKKGQKQITSQIIEINSWNWTLALILTRGIQWWSPTIKKFKIWPR